MDTRDSARAFGPFRFDPAEGTLLRNGTPLPLTPRAVDLLATLLRNRGRVISRQELESAVWGEAFVDANNLHQQIAALRKIIGNEWIETVPRRGYRFAAPEEAVTEPAQVPARREPRRRWLVPGAALALVVLASCIILYQRQPPPEPIRADSIAVLPLKAIGDGADYLGLGIADALITRLSSSSRIDVRPLSAVYSFRGVESDPMTAGRRLHVDAVLDGTAQRDGDRVLLRLRLHEVTSGRQLWSASYSESIADVFAVQDRVSAAVVDAVSGRLEPATPQKQYASVDPYVMEMYLRGRHHFAQRDRTRFEKAAQCFRKALERQPGFAPAWAGLGDVFNFMGRVPEAKDAARRALELDPTLADAHAVLGNAYLFRDRDLDAAERAFQRAIEINPSCLNARHWYAYLLAVRGRTRDAMRELEHARRIDPLSLPINASIGTLLSYEGRFDEAITAFKRVEELDPSYRQVQIELAMVYAARREFARAADALVRGEPATMNNPDHPGAAYLAALRGDRAAAERLLARAAARNVPSPAVTEYGVWAAATYVLLGRNSEALDWLSRAVAGNGADALLIGVDPRFYPLRKDARFQKVVAAATSS